MQSHCKACHVMGLVSSRGSDFGRSVLSSAVSIGVMLAAASWPVRARHRGQLRCLQCGNIWNIHMPRTVGPGDTSSASCPACGNTVWYTRVYDSEEWAQDAGILITPLKRRLKKRRLPSGAYRRLRLAQHRRLWRGVRALRRGPS